MGRRVTVDLKNMTPEQRSAYKRAASKRYYDKHRKMRVRATDVGDQRQCFKCHEFKPRTAEFFEVRTDSRAGISGVCKLCDARRRRNWAIKDRFGGTLEEYETLMADASCAICGTLERLCLDHCHDRGHVRGVLCTQCNSMLGFAKDDPNRLQGAIDYLAKTKNGL